MTSIGRQPSKNFGSSNSCNGAFSAVVTRLVEAHVIVARQRAVQIVAVAVVDAARRPDASSERDVTRAEGRLLPPARRAEHFRSIDRVGEDDGADGVVEVEMIAADERGDVRATVPGTSGGRSRQSPDRRRVTGTLVISSREIRISGCDVMRASRALRSARDRPPARHPQARAPRRRPA